MRRSFSTSLYLKRTYIVRYHKYQESYYTYIQQSGAKTVRRCTKYACPAACAQAQSLNTQHIARTFQSVREGGNAHAPQAEIRLRRHIYAIWIQPFKVSVRLCFLEMTINKAQGQSLQVCGLGLKNPCFSHKQLYVASSRVGKPSD